jgi:hypothetical protein
MERGDSKALRRLVAGQNVFYLRGLFNQVEAAGNNAFGIEMKVKPEKPSAYVWSGSDQYKAGKYVRDHVYDPNEVDVQVGCAPLLARMMALDPSIKFGLPDAPHDAPPAADPKPDPEHSFWDDLTELLTRKVF